MRKLLYIEYLSLSSHFLQSQLVFCYLYSSGNITEDGYDVEMSIPFSTFRSANSDSLNWRINFLRFIPRKESARIDSWVPIDRDNTCNPCQFGFLKGINDVDIKSPFELLPSIVGSYEDSFSSSLGFGISFPIGETATAEVTFNPDFSQVESNETKIDINNQTALSYPETRPFFNEGIDLFLSLIHISEPTRRS